MRPELIKKDPNELTTAPEEQKGAIGAAFLVWLLGGGLGLAVLVFVLLKMHFAIPGLF